MADRTKVLIMGAAGRDFHNFNTYFRERQEYEIVAFTATQIPYINDRKYPAELAGPFYPEGIPIHDESEMPELVKKYGVEVVVFAYSDVPYEYVMHRSALVNSLGADFMLMGPDKVMVKSTKPVIAVCAVRTGAGKSQTTRKIQTMLREAGKKVVSIRHPMPYGDLVAQRVQRYATLDDLKKYECTIEEMEEYEPHVMAGNVIYAGVDYEAIVREAEKEADVILWDGGNNDFSFYAADLYITVADPHRPGDGLVYYPGEVNLRLADAIVLNKIDSADRAGIEAELEAVRSVNPTAQIIMGASPVTVDKPEMIKGKRVLVVEDGPTLTHGEMKYGAGTVAARQYGAAEFIDPRPFAVGEIKATFDKYPNVGVLLPAMGYSDQQLKDLETTINASGADVVVFRIAPNPGEPARPLAKVASGGELSRISLAIEEVLADADATPTIVFDEIDAGIGGRSADPVGRALWSLARRHQVLCVTHLPQIAAYADAHLAIHKVQRDGRTVTEVHRLDEAGRLAELAAMIGGPAGGPTAQASARELRERAARFTAVRGAAGAAP
jgi:predicted GTPase